MRCDARQIVVAAVLLVALSTAAFGLIDTAWVRRYNGPGNSHDYAHALAVDMEGNVYVTGRSVGTGTYFDYATIKYSPEGEMLWLQRYNGPGVHYDWATALAVDAQGNVYVTGASHGTGTAHDYATIKYSPEGEKLWVRRYNGPGNGDDWARALAVDGQGNVYVTGESYGGPGTGFDYATIKYSPEGEELWVARYDGPGHVHDWASALAVDGQGNAYVTGRSRGLDTWFDYATIKYGPDGTELWVARYNGPGNSSDEAHALVVDRQGNVYVTGRSQGSNTGWDYATIKYSPEGDELWVKRYNGPGNGDDWARALVVDGQGSVYVTGESESSGAYRDYATIKYNPDGEELWVRRYNGPGNERDEAYAVAVDRQGNVYVTGNSTGSGTSSDYATIKYSPEGDELWVARYNGPGDGWDRASALAVDGRGDVYVTGYSTGSGTGYDYATIRYVQSGGVAGGEVPSSLPQIMLGPNPVMGEFATLRYSLASPGPVSVSVYDVTGRTVLSRSLAASRTGAVSLDMRSLSAGIYLVRVEAEGFTATRKLVVQR